MNYRSSQHVWAKHFPAALGVMALTLIVFNTFQWSRFVDADTWPYGTSLTTLFAYLVSQVLDMKAAIFVSIIVAIVALVVLGMKVRPILKSAFSTSNKNDTRMMIILFLAVFLVVPVVGIWAFADRIVVSPHVYINLFLPSVVGAIWFAGKTQSASQWAETRTRATDSVEETNFNEEEGDAA